MYDLEIQNILLEQELDNQVLAKADLNRDIDDLKVQLEEWRERSNALETTT